MSPCEYFIGIDGGGTQCRAQLEDSDGYVLGTATSGPANIVSNKVQATQSILMAVNGAVESSGLSIALNELHVAAGLAGANVAAARTTFDAQHWPFRTFATLSDLHAACLGAHKGEDGILVICGTGSAATCYREAGFSDKGGYGLTLGDNGSGAWLGVEAVRHTLLCIDALTSHSLLSRNIMTHFGVVDGVDMVEKTMHFCASDFGKLSPLVFAAFNEGCEAAASILHLGAGYLSQLIRSMSQDRPLPVALVGGLAESYQPLLGNDISKQLCVPAHNAQKGAIHYLKETLLKSNAEPPLKT